MGHVLWDLPLNAKDLHCGPRVTVNWHFSADTEGSYQETPFLSAELNATELREQHQFLTWIQHEFRQTVLVDFPKDGTWEKRWKEWNRRFPDWAFPSPEAMRKNVDYWEKSLRARAIGYQTADVALCTADWHLTGTGPDGPLELNGQSR